MRLAEALSSEKIACYHSLLLIQAPQLRVRCRGNLTGARQATAVMHLALQVSRSLVRLPFRQRVPCFYTHEGCMIPLFCSELGLTCSKLADSVQQLKLPALLHIMDGLGYLAAWGLNVEFQAKTIDISISCRDPQLFSAFACICAALVGDVYMPPSMSGQYVVALPYVSFAAALTFSVPRVMSSKGSDNPSEARMTLPFGLRTSLKACRRAGHFGPPERVGLTR